MVLDFVTKNPRSVMNYASVRDALQVTTDLFDNIDVCLEFPVLRQIYQIVDFNPSI